MGTHQWCKQRGVAARPHRLSAVGGSRRALQRLCDWAMCNDLGDIRPSYVVSGGAIAMFFTDAQRASRSSKGGLSVPVSLRSGLVFAHRNLGLRGIDIYAPCCATIATAPARAPVPAESITVRIFWHF